MSFLDSVRKAVKRHDIEGKAEAMSRFTKKVGAGAVAGVRGIARNVDKFEKWQDKRAVENLSRERVRFERIKLAQKIHARDFSGPSQVPLGGGSSAPRRAAPSQRGGNANYYRRLYEARVKKDLGIEREADRYDRG